MEEQYKSALEILKKQDINGCITGSYMLGYHEGWNQDIDLFVFDQSSLNKILFFMHYNPMFQILDPMEKHKFNDLINNGKSSLDNIGLITIKFKYNLLIDINIVFKKFQKNVFDVISNFDISIIAKGYDIKTGQTLDLSGYNGDKIVTWNKWNPTFYKADFWNIKRILRQFERITKYTNRGYDLTEVTDKYISLVEEIVSTSNFYKSEKGVKYFEDTIEQFQIVLKILKLWKKDGKISESELLTLKTLI